MLTDGAVLDEGMVVETEELRHAPGVREPHHRIPSCHKTVDHWQEERIKSYAELVRAAAHRPWALLWAQWSGLGRRSSAVKSELLAR